MARKRVRAAEVSAEKAAVLGPDTMVFTDEMVGDEPVLVLEQAPANWVEIETAKRRAADAVRAEAWANVGGMGPSRAATPLRGSRCERCGSTSSLLASVQSSGPYMCALGCL